MVFEWTEVTIEFGYRCVEKQQENVVGEGRRTKANAITSGVPSFSIGRWKQDQQSHRNCKRPHLRHAPDGSHICHMLFLMDNLESLAFGFDRCFAWCHATVSQSSLHLAKNILDQVPYHVRDKIFPCLHCHR
jgi:hypothetical protein